MNRVCTKCSTEKPIESFYKDKNGREGHRSSCKQCDIKKSKRWNKANADKHKEHQKSWRHINREKSRNHRKQYVSTQKGKNTIKKWHQKNPNYNKESGKRFRKNNPGYASHYARLRKKQIMLATPKWLTGLDMDEIKSTYRRCADLNYRAGYIKYHVDHIVPLVAKDVDGNHVACGLHVPANLQIVKAKDNLSKGAKLEDSPNW